MLSLGLFSRRIHASPSFPKLCCSASVDRFVDDASRASLPSWHYRKTAYRTNTTTTASTASRAKKQHRLSKILSLAPNLTLSRREAERLIRSGQVTMAGQIVQQPQLLVNAQQVATVRVKGKLLQLQQQEAETGDKHQTTSQYQPSTRVWLVHKLAGELVADFDPHQRPLLMERLKRAGVGRLHNSKQQQKWHLKPVGRLDVSTEGLMVVTNDGQYARDMELPAHRLHRTYRVRVHGILNPYKLARMERGLMIEGTRYRGMKVTVERARRGKASSTNQWITVTCTEGKNRQVRNVLQHLGCTSIMHFNISVFLANENRSHLCAFAVNVTRLIRIAFGDYQLQTIPPGMAIEVPMKPVEKQKHRGLLFKPKDKNSKPESTVSKGERARPVQWIRHY